MKFNTKDLSVIAVYIACSVTIGFVFAPVPNFELITASIFLGGYIHGKLPGVVIGTFSAFLWSSLNPWGSGFAYPTLLIAQVLVFGIIGFCGGLIRLIINPRSITLKSIIIFGISGFVLTVLHDVITSIGGFLPMGFTIPMLKTILIAGMPFSMIHIIVNTGVFVIIIPSLIKAFVRISLFEKYLCSN